MGIEYEPLNPANWNNPYPIYRQLREQPGIYQSPEGLYCLSRFDDVAFALKHAELFSSSSAFETAMISRAMGRPKVRDVLEIVRFLFRSRINPLEFRHGPPENLITCDAPRHDALRSIVNRGFTPRRIEPLEERVREIVAGCMTRLRDGHVFDVVHDLAIPLPLTVIAEVLGIESDALGRFKGWSDAIVAASSGSQRGDLGGLLRSLGELNAYMRPIVRERRAHPKDDLISVLVDPSRDGALDERAIQGFVVLLLIAGNETTTNLIGNATLTLLDHPEALERLRADPGAIPAAVEEVIRYDSPVQFVLRRAGRDVEVAGTSIPKDALCAVLLSAANRDESRFPDPDRFDIDRDTNGHLGFGFGIHFCLGASLARLEAKVALEALVPVLSRRSRRTSEVRYVDSFLVRGPSHLELDAA